MVCNLMVRKRNIWYVPNASQEKALSMFMLVNRVGFLSFGSDGIVRKNEHRPDPNQNLPYTTIKSDSYTVYVDDDLVDCGNIYIRKGRQEALQVRPRNFDIHPCSD